MAEVVDLIVRLEDDPERRAILQGAPYSLFQVAVSDDLVGPTDLDGFASVVGVAVRRGLVGYEAEAGGVILPPPQAPWNGHAFQSRFRYHSTVEGQRMAALYRERRGGGGQAEPDATDSRPQRDVFISHAHEDKDAIARPLAEELRRRGLSVWFDEYELVLGDSLRRKIGDGLKHSRVGLVILSPSFFAKPWPQYELDGLTARQIAGETNVILPVWHEIGLDEVRSHSPPLADLLAARSSDGVRAIADGVVRVLERLAEGEGAEAALQEAGNVQAEAPTHSSQPGGPTSMAPSAGGVDASPQTQRRTATDRLVRAVSDSDASVRFEAMAALRSRLNPDLLPVIEPLLDDGDNYIRQMAVEYYSELTGQEGTDRLVQAVSDNDASVRFEAMAALRSRLNPDLLPVIGPLLDDGDNYIRQMAVEYYSELTGQEGTDRLVRAVSDNDASVRFEAMAALRSRLNPELLPVIEPLLDDGDSYIRQMAVEYYSELTGR